jgi:hypothetical protein
VRRLRLFQTRLEDPETLLILVITRAVALRPSQEDNATGRIRAIRAIRMGITRGSRMSITCTRDDGKRNHEPDRS